MTPADRTGAIREPAAGGRRRPTALPRPLGSLAPLRARIKVPILTLSSGTLKASLSDRALWTNQAGKPATDTTPFWTDWTGSTVTLSPYDGFTKAMKNVKLVGLSFGRAGAYASGVAITGSTPGIFNLETFTIAP